MYLQNYVLDQLSYKDINYIFLWVFHFNIHSCSLKFRSAVPTSLLKEVYLVKAISVRYLQRCCYSIRHRFQCPHSQ